MRIKYSCYVFSMRLTSNESPIYMALGIQILVVIVFVKFQARRETEGIKLKDDKEELVVGKQSPSRESLGTSIEVQTGNSVEVFPTQEERVGLHHRIQQKARTQSLKLKVTSSALSHRAR